MNTSPEHQRPPSKRSRHRHRLRFDGGSGVSNSRHRILREVIRELRRQPFVTAVRGHPPSTFTEVRAEVAPERWGLDVETATLRVTWIPLDPPEFTIHYSDETFDCGWHHEPNPHVERLAHYQERVGDSAYQYEPTTFDGETAPELVWELLERLNNRLAERTDNSA